MVDQLRKVDHSVLKVNQAVIIILLIAAFVVNVPWIVAAVSLIMLIGTAIARPGFFFIYTGLLKPLGIVKPHVLADNPEPHRFAQGFGGVVSAASAAILLLGGSTVVGWALAWLVVVL
jgi:hypothetical protein